MSAPRWVTLIGAALLLCGLGSCALLGKSAPITPRYFSPERPGDLTPLASERPEPVVQVRLGRVTSADSIGDLIITRVSATEVVYSRLRRWTEAPDQYLKRRLARVLFEERGLGEATGGDAPTLDVQLTAFEEIRAPRHVARVQVMARLRDEGRVTWQETLTIEQPVTMAAGDESADAMVESIGVALRTVVDRIAERVVLELTRGPTS